MLNKKLTGIIKILFNNNDLRSITISVFIKVVGLFFSFLLNIVLVRSLGSEAYGEYIYFISLINFFSMISIFGLDNTGLKFLSKYYSLKDSNNFINFLKKSLRFVFYFSILISATLFFTSFIFYQNFGIKYYLIFSSLILIPLKSITSIYFTAIRAIEKMFVYLCINLIVRQLFLIVLVIIIKKLNWFNISAFEILALIGIIHLLIIIFSAHYINTNLSLKYFNVKKEKINLNHQKISFYIFFIQAVSLFNININNISIDYFIGPKQVSLYAIASQLALIVGFTLNAINVFLAPTISKLFFNNNINELQKKLTLVAKLNLLSGLASTILILIFGKTILNLFGESMIEAYPVVLILIIGTLFHLFCGSVTYLMIMTKIEKIAAMLTAISALINITFNFILIPKYGIIGCSISTTISVVFYNLLSTYFILRKLKINPTIFSLFKT